MGSLGWAEPRPSLPLFRHSSPGSPEPEERRRWPASALFFPWFIRTKGEKEMAGSLGAPPALPGVGWPSTTGPVPAIASSHPSSSLSLSFSLFFLFSFSPLLLPPASSPRWWHGRPAKGRLAIDDRPSAGHCKRPPLFFPFSFSLFSFSPLLLPPASSPRWWHGRPRKADRSHYLRLRPSVPGGADGGHYPGLRPGVPTGTLPSLNQHTGAGLAPV